MEYFVVFLPLPPAALFPNDKSHWTVKQRHIRLARWRANVEARKALGNNPAPYWRKAALVVRFSFPGACRHDPSNLMRSLKAYEDALQDAGIIVNDKGLWPERPEIVTDRSLIDHPSPAWRRGAVRMVVKPEEVTGL